VIEKFLALAQDYAHLAIDYLGSTTVLVQLGIIILLFPPALLIGRRLAPLLKERARGIKDMPGLLRLIVSFLNRLAWLFYSLFLGFAHATTSAIAWPASNYLIYVAALLASAWLIISVASHALRNRLLRTLFAYAAWILVAATILGVDDDAAALLDQTGLNVGEVRISVLSVLQGFLLLAAAMWLSNSIGGYLERKIKKLDELTPSLRVLLGKVIRISLLILAAFIVISGMGIDLTALTVLSGAVGVGIGFGLQKVVSNFISGIIILVDQSIKPGDTISLGETFGWIRELRARFVSVVTRDGREFLIPNEDFITQEVVNWSFSDRYVRLDVEFGVTYDTDPHEVIRIAVDAASKVNRVDATQNRPVCWLVEFGDSSLNFVLRFWISDPKEGLTNIKGAVLIELWDALKEHDIAIPYPHREVILRSPIAVTTGSGT
jgi:small-conductance mechanosensitive channel